MQYGAGSVRCDVGRRRDRTFLGSASSATQFVDHFPRRGPEYDYQWEERWIRDEGYLKIVPETSRVRQGNRALGRCDRSLLPVVDRSRLARPSPSA
jgi:hypothetical protein